MIVDFPHIAPKEMYYESEPFQHNVLAIWIHYKRKFDYNLGDSVRCIWGFYNTKTKCYHSPVNSKKCGKKVDIKNTTPYSAMQIKLTPLEQAFI